MAIDFNKIFIYTTGKRLGQIHFNDLPRDMIIQHPLPAMQAIDFEINQNTVTRLFELTSYGTASQVMSSTVFKQGLIYDWFRAFNEFGIEVDNYTVKAFSNLSDYADGEVPVYNSTINDFEPGTTGGSVAFNANFATKTTDDLTEGITNFYASPTRVQNSTLGTLNPQNSPVANNDSVKTAVNKLQGQLTALGVAAKSTQLTFTQQLPANQAFRVDISTLYAQKIGDTPDLDTSESNFNSNLKIIIERNGTPLDKGIEVTRLSSNTVSFSEIISIDENIFIYS